MNRIRTLCALLVALTLTACANTPTLRGTGDLGVIVERGVGSLLLVENSGNRAIGRVTGLGDLSHASVVYSRDARFAYVFGRDGGLTKVDLLTQRIVKRVIQSGNSIGGAISADGKLIAVSNYTPGGVKVFSAETLELLADIPASYGDQGARAKVIGLVDAPGNRFVFSLFEGDAIWVADVSDPRAPVITKFEQVGRLPYDGTVTPDGRYYTAGLFGEDGLARVDLWYPERGVTRVLPDYGRGGTEMPVYKMPHLDNWASAGGLGFMPAVARHEVLVVDQGYDWKPVARIPVHGQPVFVVAQPGGRQIWVNYAFPNNDTVQVIDVATLKVVKTIKPGPAVLHMEFTPRGEQVWISVRDANRVDVYDSTSFARVASLSADKPSGIFFTPRAHRIGQ